MKRLLFLLGLFVMLNANAQYFQFSQINFTPQRISPAHVAGTDNAVASAISRSQQTAGGFNLHSNMLSLSYPLISKKGIRWGGFGLSIMDDRAGYSGIYKTQEIGLSYATHIALSKTEGLSMGVKAMNVRRQVDLRGLFTGAQYIDGRGFDEGTATGEPFANLVRTSLYTFSAGFNYKKVGNKGQPVRYASMSFFDFNKVIDQQDFTSQLSSTMVMAAGIEAATFGKIHVLPEILYTRSSATHAITLGVVNSYIIDENKREILERVDFITKYAFNRSIVVGLQFHKRNVSYGVSYDVPTGRENVANLGAFEVGIELRKLVRKSRYGGRQKRTNDTEAKPEKKRPVSKSAPPDRVDQMPEKNEGAQHEDLKERFRTKMDSINAHVTPGNISHERFTILEATLRFEFNFNSSDLKDEFSSYFDELADALIENPDLLVQLIGHTDNVGSVAFNQKLSESRAAAARDELILRGVSASRIISEGKGMTQPLNSNKTERERAENRRVELKVYVE
ncbi:MAG TPA: PorP/SprF family type IX secretion system membrane protein [Chryseosolibacter sp.]|nr:PorP/SprF family type IX secretion system membrane protein [Chryseosolibacter sp.]